MRRTITRPGGQPARPGQEGRAHADTHGTRAWRPLTRKGTCQRPHRTAPLHRLSPLWNDERHGKPHANHRSARSQRRTPEGPARDNAIPGPRTGTTRGAPRAPASAGASGRHHEPGSRPASMCPTQPPSKFGGKSPRGAERHQGVRKADQSTERKEKEGRRTKHQTTRTAAKTRRKQNRRGRGKGRHSAKAVDTSGWKPEKASDNKGAQ